MSIAAMAAGKDKSLLAKREVEMAAGLDCTSYSVLEVTALLEGFSSFSSEIMAELSALFNLHTPEDHTTASLAILSFAFDAEVCSNPTFRCSATQDAR